MKTMAGKAGFEQRLTKNGTRKWMMRKLNDINVPLTHIMQLSGHQQYADNSVPPNTALTAKSSQTEATTESSFMNSSVIPASGAFSGAIFHGGTLILQ